MTAGLEAVEARPAVRLSPTIAGPGTGGDPLRTYLSSSRAQEMTGRAADGEGYGPTETADEVQAQCLKGRKGRRRYLRRMIRSCPP